MQTAKDAKLVKQAVQVLQGMKEREPTLFSLIQEML
jgi:hypothetical protein